MTDVPKWTLDQMNLFDLGNTIRVAGVIYADHEVAYITMLPKEKLDDRVLRVLELSREDWDKVIEQTDKLQKEVLAKSSDGELAKIIIRKCNRNISQQISWTVYRRDGFKCRYCGADDVPMTVDHLVTWETGGPSTVDNLVTSCKRCNSARGEMEYGKWLESGYYLRASRGVERDIQLQNAALVDTLDDIPRLVHKRKKR